MSTVGRNDPCSCGSGRKAKNCCQGPGGSAGKARTIALPLADGLQSQPIPFSEAVRIAQDRQQHGDTAGAEKIYKLILAVDPDHGDALFFLGVLNHQMGRAQQAFELMKRATLKHPKVFLYQFNFGYFCFESGNMSEAIASYRRAVAIDPRPVALDHLGTMLMQIGELDEAAECCRQAIQRQPREQSANLYNNLAIVLQQQGKLKEAIESIEAGLAITPDDSVMRNNYLYTLNFLADPDLAKVFEAHRQFGRLYDRPLPPRDVQEDRAAGTKRRLRVGYVSPDFRQHSVSYFIEPILAAHDKEKFEVFCYSNNAQVDDYTTRIKGLVPSWRLIHNRSEEEVAELIRRDGIDLLVDLAGHTQNSRLLLFGLKPAPVQVTWLGYPNTTGLTTMDWRITDRFADPPGESDKLHTEKLWRMPECFSCFQPQAASPDVGPLPALKNGHVTFGSFNNFAKTTPQVIAVWARILKRVPGSRLVLKNKSMSAPGVQNFILSIFAKHGVAAGSIEMRGQDGPHASHLEQYNTIDIGLDPFPYNGTTTTFEALWMGVPMVVLAGVSHVGRVGVSQMSNLGLPELIGKDPNDYVEIAARLAADVPRLTALRAGLRQRMIASPLMDVPRFTRNLETAYQEMWKMHTGSKAS
ncbi:MAG: tetratricopeptide repeat protein [Planctomycetes bacterium]|nr:tetratricopeptide repeat protein [Planctomycetota bacterium]